MDYLDLADQVSDLEIFGICGCNESNCSTFYSLPKPEGSYGPTHENVIDAEKGLVVLDVENRKVARMEVLDRPDFKQKLNEVLGS